MNQKVVLVVSSLLLLFSQTSILSQSSFANTTLASTPSAQESQSNPSSADAPMKRRSAGTRFIDLQVPDLENNNPNLYYPDAWGESQDSNISMGLEKYQQGDLAAALQNLSAAEAKFASLASSLSNDELPDFVRDTLPTIPRSETTNIPDSDRDSSKPTPLPNPEDVEEYAAIANATGLIYRNLKEWDKSEAYFIDALSAFTTIDNNIGRSIALTNLGTNYRQLKQPQAALNYYRLALKSEQNSDRQNQKYILNQIALAYYASGDKQKSLDYFQKVLAIAEEEENALNQGVALNNIGEVYRSLGQQSAARRHYKLALENLSDSNNQLTTTVEENIASNSFEDESSLDIIGDLPSNENTGANSTDRIDAAHGINEGVGSSQRIIGNNNSLSEETTFTCGAVDGVPTTIASTMRGDIAFINWNSDYFSSTGYTPQQRCETVANRLKRGYQNGLKYLTTGIKNGLNVICMTSTIGGDCQEVLLTPKPEDDPQQTLQALFNIRTGGSSQALNEDSLGSREFIDFEKYLETAPTIGESEHEF